MMKDFLNNCIAAPWKAQKLKGDSGERGYSRIRSPKGTFIFVTHSGSNKNFEDFISTQEFFKKNLIPIPQVFHIDKRNKFLLLEDLGKMDLEHFYLENKKLTYHFKALDLLHSFQQDLDPSKFKKKFNEAQGLNEMLLAYQSLNQTLDNSNKEQLFKEFRKICYSLAEQPFVPSHRDFHSRNLMIYQDQIYMIDFQDAGLYPQYYDLVSLVYDSYVSLSEEEKTELIQYYGQKQAQPVCMESLYLTFYQRTFKAIGNFMNFYNLRRQTQHLQYIHPCLLELKKHLSKTQQYPYFLNYINFLLDLK